MKTPGTKWIDSFIVTILTCLLLELTYVLYILVFDDYKSAYQNEWTLSSFWIIATIIPIVYLICRYQDITKYLVAFLMLFMPMSMLKVIPMKSNLESFKRYYGEHYRTSDETIYVFKGYDAHNNEIVEEEYVEPEIRGKLQLLDSDQLSKNYYHYTFLYWQSGYAFGFFPLSKSNFLKSDKLIDKLSIYFTVGPLLVLETGINGLIRHFWYFLLIQIIWFLYAGKSIWFG